MANFATIYEHPTFEPHVFDTDSITDKTAYVPLSVTIERQLAAGELRAGQLRGVYDFKNGDYVDIAKVDTCPYYEPDFVEGASIYENYKARYEKKLADAQKAKEVKASETVSDSSPVVEE